MLNSLKPSSKLLFYSKCAFFSGFFQNKPYIFFDKKYRMVTTKSSKSDYSKTTPNDICQNVVQLAQSAKNGILLPTQREKVTQVLDKLPACVENFSSPSFLNNKTFEELNLEAQNIDTAMLLYNQLLQTSYGKQLGVTPMVFSGLVQKEKKTQIFDSSFDENQELENENVVLDVNFEIEAPVRKGFDARIERPEKLAIKQSELMEFLQKSAYRSLNESEQEQLDALDMASMVYLTSGELVKPEIFRVEKNNVIRIVLTFKNSDVRGMAQEFITKDKLKRTFNTKLLPKKNTGK